MTRRTNAFRKAAATRRPDRCELFAGAEQTRGVGAHPCRIEIIVARSAPGRLVWHQAARGRGRVIPGIEGVVTIKPLKLMDEVQNDRESDATDDQSDTANEIRFDFQTPAYIALVAEPIISAGLAVPGLHFAE